MQLLFQQTLRKSDMHREATVFGGFMLILGVFGIANGIAILIRGVIHAEGSSCKAICGISLLLAQFFNPAVGAVSAGSIYLLIGSCIAVLGFMVLRNRQKTQR